MDQGRVTIRRAEPRDIPFIMSVERLPGYAEFVGAWSAEEHERKMADDDHAYFLALSDREAAGFAIMKGLSDPMGNMCLNRIAVAQAGGGTGLTFVTQLSAWAFGVAGFDRLWLDVLPGNDRARHVYRKAGFVEEGVMRSALRYPDGRRADLLLMSLLRAEWSGEGA